MNDFSMFAKEACQGGCEHDVITHSALCSWMGRLTNQSIEAFNDTRQLYGLQGVPNFQLLSLPAGVRIPLRHGETTWTFDFGVFSPP